MQSVECGPGVARFEIVNDGVGHASLLGLIMPANVQALSAMLLQAMSDAGASALICSIERGLIALPPIAAKHYSYIAPDLRSIPVAIMVTPEQAPVHDGIAEAAALSGAIRRAFLWREEAELWLQPQIRALNANRVWWSASRSPQ